MITLSGKVIRFEVPAVGVDDVESTPQLVALMCSPLGEFRRFTRVYLYSENSGKGEQRGQTESHVKTLRKALGKGEYVPTTLAVSLYDRHRKSLVLSDDGGFVLDVDVEKKDGLLPLSDGGHRFASFELMRNELLEQMKGAEGELLEQLTGRLARLDATPIPYLLYLDGADPKATFIKLQLGRAVDRTHMLALSLKKGSDPDLLAARAAAMELNKAEGTFFKGMIRFSDAQAAKRGAVVKKVPFNSFCQTGASDLSFSLVGLSKICTPFGFDPATMSELVVQTVKALNVSEEHLDNEDYQQLTSEEMVLTPLDVGGVVGGATLYVGAAACLAYRLGKAGKTSPEKDDLDALIDSALETLNVEVNGGMDNSRKRRLMGQFARHFFADSQEKKVDGVPLGLLLAVGSAAAYDVDKTEFAQARKEEQAA